MEGRLKTAVPADAHLLKGYTILDSSNVQFVGWDNENHMFVWFISGGVYRYDGVSRQRTVAAALAKSVGSYIAKKIKPNYAVQRVV